MSVIKTFTFVFTTGAPATFHLNRTALALAGLKHTGLMVISHGARRTQATVAPIYEDGQLLPVTSATAEALGLVEGIPYQLRWSGGELRIGPVIGILAARRSDEIDLSPGALARQFLLRYSSVGGLVYLFGAEDVDLETETITGFRWECGEPDDTGTAVSAEWERARKLAARVLAQADGDAPAATVHPRTARFQAMAGQFLAETPVPEPHGNWHGSQRFGEGRFVHGRFPFPAAIWRRAGFLSQTAHDRLVSRIGPRLFNSSFFNKQQGYTLLSAYPEIRKHLPEAEPFTNVGRVFARLDHDGSVILKQVEGNSGYGLMRIERTAEGYILRFRETNRAELYPTRPEMEQRLWAIMQGGGYLLQQWIDLPAHEGRLNDYRVMMQKDDRAVWSAAAIIGRFGQRGSIVTNFINDGYALPPDEALQRAFMVDRREAFRLKEDIIRFSVDVCKTLDATGGCYGDLGLDIGIDRNRKLWLFEVNKLPFLELPLYMGDEQTYLSVKSGPLLYAAYLAGFGR